MNYIELINHFWRMHRLHEFSPKEAFLYFALLNECNLRSWQNPFACTNKSLCATTGMTEKAIIDVRKRLEERGMITCTAGVRGRKAPVYSLLYSDLNCQNESQNGNIINKTETKTESPGGKAGAEREKGEKGKEKGESRLPADAPLPLDRCRAALEADAPWAARLARLHCRGDTADLLRLMDRFFTRLEAEAVERKSPADARSHFARWLALRAAHDKPLKHMQYGSTKTKKDYART